jgi:hypothetical protein
MTLETLGRQYAAEADTLEGMIASCNERRRFAIRAGDSKEAHRQEKLAELHTQQQKDLLKLAAWLKHYYGDSGDEAPREEPTTSTNGKVQI